MYLKKIPFFMYFCLSNTINCSIKTSIFPVVALSIVESSSIAFATLSIILLISNSDLEILSECALTITSMLMSEHASVILLFFYPNEKPSMMAIVFLQCE